MRRLLVIILVAAGGGGWFFFHKYRIVGFDHLAVKPQGVVAGTSGDAELPAWSLDRPGATIRIASFDVESFGLAKLSKPSTMKSLCDVLRRFDVTALQEVRSPRDDIMPRLIEQLNAAGAIGSAGRHFDYVIGPRRGHGSAKEQLAFVFDTATIEVDRTGVYTVDDPGHRLSHEPLVAAFRAHNAPAGDAFTFTLVDVHVELGSPASEQEALADAFRAVRDDGRGEDDIIMLGNLSTDDRHLGMLGQLPNIACALTGVATNTRGTKMYDNVLFNRQATVEFTGRAGVLDVQHELNLPMSQALDLSDHLPIWAEFSVYEGGQPGRMASRGSSDHWNK
jgi:endonuclease/exonuclease/phosphatase family metal-dependent hydrolase